VLAGHNRRHAEVAYAAARSAYKAAEVAYHNACAAYRTALNESEAS